MTKTNQFLAGTALCLLMASPIHAGAKEAAPVAAGQPMHRVQVPLMLAQAEAPGGNGQGEAGQDCPPGTSAAPDEGGCVVLEDAPAVEEAPAEEAPVEEEPAAEPEPAEPPTEAEPSEQPAEAPVEPAEPEASEAEEPAEAGSEAPEEAPAEAAPQAEEQPAQEEPADAGEGQEVPSDPGAAETLETQEQPAAEDCPSGTQVSEAGECLPAGEAAEEAEEAPIEEAPAEDVPAEEAPEEAPADAAPPAQEDGAQEAEPAEEQPVEETAPEAAEPTGETEEAPAIEDTQQEDGQADQPPADTEAGTDEAEPAPGAGETVEEGVLPENAAPVLDSQKEEGVEQPAEQPAQPGEEQATEPEADAPQEQQAEEAPPPESDQAAQEEAIDPEQLREEIRAIVQDEGQRIELGDDPEVRRERRREFFQPREGARVIEEYNDNRTIIEVDNHVFIESPDYERIVRRGDNVWYEELRGGRVREVVERGDGTRVITIRNRYGDVVRRVRVTPDGREYVLVYVPEDRFDEVRPFRDPAYDLPPLQLTIPVSEYILEAEQVDDPDRYYTFLSQPPVEPVRRLYSLDEVRYSARVRDMVRRVDLDTIEFEFGSARIEESEIQDLEALANAILEMLEQNPAETFLIEGHTDAVGSELANLALSDRRADAVARALTDVFDVPPENLATQGYGEQYLKVDTQEPERENRRVAVRRITPLVAPVASQQ